MQAILRPWRCFDRFDEVRRLQQRVVRAGVEPGEAAAEELDVQLPALEIVAVDVGDLQLAAGRGLQAGGDVDDLVVVEIQARSPRSCDLGWAGFSSIDERAAARRRTRRRRIAPGP